MFDGLARRWRDDPPPGFVIAAGITTSAPAVGRLLRVISRLPNGEVVLPGLDLGMADEEWDLLGPVETGDGRVYHCESHPQFQLKLLLDHRSEEHTSELQSLMRISYAVFCLKKKNMKQQNYIQLYNKVN